MRIRKHTDTAPDDEDIWHEMTITFDEKDDNNASMTIMGTAAVVAIGTLMYARASSDMDEVKRCTEIVFKQGAHKILEQLSAGDGWDG